MAQEIKLSDTNVLLTPQTPHVWQNSGCKWQLAMLLLCRLALAFILLWAGIPKIMDPARFLAEVRLYAIFSPLLSVLAAITLPWIEFLLAICLVANLFLRDALFCSISLFSVYILGQAYVLYRGLVIPCGCGLGPQGEIVGAFTITRTTVLLLIALSAYFLAARTCGMTSEEAAVNQPSA